ncbi:MAG: molecular chaperone HtpG [Fretibacterium sp.]|nr:molecular chaperone HtpG [Fretibacterium sp.]
MTEKLYFQSEAAELLRLMIHSVYSNRDIFLRELISNASDALDKRRIEGLSNSEYADFSPQIRLARDAERRTLSISDNGIGMTRDEIVNYIGTIAKSGTREFLAAAGKDPKAQEQLIGQFGVGFYSAFMVAERVELVSRKLGTGEAWRFDSTGDEFYSLSEAERAECGTTVTLHLGPVGEDGKDYLDEWTLREIVKKYSDFIAWPIVMQCSQWKDGKESFEDQTLNSRKAIWARPESEVSEEEYKEFYRHLTHDWREPLKRVMLNAEGSVSFRGILFLPQEPTLDLFMNPKSGGLSLYIKRVFIMNDYEELIPDYMRFVRGVVDSEDLPLNISRELLQEDPVMRVIRRSTQRKIFGTLRKMSESERDKYEKFWEGFGRIFKEGVVQDREHVETILELCLFRSTALEGWTTLAEYKSRMKEGQEGIYCLCGKEAILRSSPKLETFSEKGFEVLLMSDPVDELIVANRETFDGSPLLNAALTDIETEEERKRADEAIKALEEDFAPLKKLFLESDFMKPLISDVRLSTRMKASPSCLQDGEGGVSIQMEHLMRAMGREFEGGKRVLELNPEHPVVRRLMELAHAGDDRAVDFAPVLYDQALLLEGGTVSDPGTFAKKLSALLEIALEA